MDLRTFRRNGPGLAECESQAAWRRLWGTVGRIGPWTRADRSRTWPHLGHNLDTRRANLLRRRAAKVSGYGAWLRGAHGVGRGHDMTPLGRLAASPTTLTAGRITLLRNSLM